MAIQRIGPEVREDNRDLFLELLTYGLPAQEVALSLAGATRYTAFAN